jgi:hypothetical protein
MTKKTIAAEFARRAIQFHPNERPMSINLWGHFSWGTVSKLIKKGDIIPNPGYSRINKTIWCKPSLDFFNKEIEPLLKKPLIELTKLAGWN